MIPPKLLLILGPTASGKSTAGRALASKGWQHIEASDVFRRLIAKRSIQAPDDVRAADRLFEIAGFDAVSQSVLDNLGNGDLEPVALSGLRTPEEILTLLVAPVSVRIVSLQARFSTRLGRTEESAECMTQRDRKESSWGLLPISADLADRIIVNESTLQAFLAEIQQVEEWSNWSAKGTPSNVARLRLATLIEADAGARVSDPTLAALVEPQGLARRAAHDHWTLSRSGRAYLALMRHRWPAIYRSPCPA